MVFAYFSGLIIGFSLIIAIGAQNAFVLQQGLRREHVFTVCLICALSDAILIFIGVVGAGFVAKQLPWLDPIMRFGGAIFLFIYGLRKLIPALLAQAAGLAPSSDTQTSLSKVILLCLAFTWLNPHVYLDTVVLVGSISANYGEQKLFFALGAMSASFLFFFSLGYGARLLQSFFSRPASWRILDVLIGILMISLAFGLTASLIW